LKSKLEQHIDKEEKGIFPLIRQRMSPNLQEGLGQQSEALEMSVKTKWAA
jgi:hemerythrin-like domain-containing protein